MCHLRSIAALILLQCVLTGFAVPHREHHTRSQHQRDDHQAPHDSQLDQKTPAKHHLSKHRSTTGAQRETVPSPLQDFVLVSGSPLFHERPRARDAKNQTLPTAAETNQLPKQEQKQPSDLSNNSTTITSGPESEQKHENGTAQQQPPATKPDFKHPKEFANAGLSKEKEQPKSVNSSTTNEPTLPLTLQAPKDSSSGVGIGVATQGNTSVDQGKAAHGENASLALNTISTGKKGEGEAGTSSSVEIKGGRKENQTTTLIAADVKNQKPHFPFNITGIRNYGKEKTDNKEPEPNKQLTDREKKLGLDQILGPNCHWKTTTGKNGEKITSVSCSGEFKKPDDHKVGMDKEGKPSPPGESAEGKEAPTGNTSISETAGDEKKMQEQSEKEFEEEAVITTNALRKIHRALPMKLNPELSRQAKEYAEKISSMGSLQHDVDAVRQLDEGENLAMGCKQFGVPLTAKEAITNWYNEVCSYDFDRGEFSMSTGHFTQVVWSDSKEFGIGKATGQQNGMPCVFVVGRFKPSGNYKGEYKKNVFKGTFDPSYCDKLRDKKLV